MGKISEQIPNQKKIIREQISTYKEEKDNTTLGNSDSEEQDTATHLLEWLKFKNLTQLAISYKNPILPYSPSITILGTYPAELKSCPLQASHDFL